MIDNTKETLRQIIEKQTRLEANINRLAGGGRPGSFTNGCIPFAQSNGRLGQSIALSFSTGVLSTGGTGAGATSSIEIGGTATGNRYSYIDFHGDDTYTDYGIRIIRQNAGANANSNIVHRGTGLLTLESVEAGAIAFNTNNTERLRVISSGNIGIGTSSPTARLDVIDGCIRARDGTNTAPSAGTGLEFMYAGGTGYIISFDRTGGTTKPLQLYVQFADIVANTVAIGRFSSNGLYLGGNVNSAKLIELSADSAGKPTTNTWQIISDARTKRKVKPYTTGFDLIRQIVPVYFEYNGKGGTPEGETGVGVLAQDIDVFAPQMIRRVKAKIDNDDDERLEYQGNEVQYALINSMKEAFARIEKLESKNSK